MLIGIIQKPTLGSYFTTKRVISIPGLGDIITRGTLELICKCLHFANSETIKFSRTKEEKKARPHRQSVVSVAQAGGGHCV
jgi:hypothetical protein